MVNLSLLRFIAPSYAVVLLVTARGILGGSNRTIDDNYADGTISAPVSYSPPDQWFQGALCSSNCTARVDTAQAYDHTWHLAENFPSSPSSVSMELQFFGTAVYVYNILSNTTATSLTFSLDGQGDGNPFVHTPTGSEDVQYNALVYSNNNLTNTAHSLLMRVQMESVVLFDYAVYTVVDADSGGLASSAMASQTSHPAPSAIGGSGHGASIPIIAGTVAGVIGTIVLILSIFLFRRRRRSAARSSSRPKKTEAGKADVAEEARVNLSRIGRANRSYRRTFMLEREAGEPVTSSLSRLSARSLMEEHDVERLSRTSITGATEATRVSAGDSSVTPTILPFPLEVQPSPNPSKSAFLPPSLSSPRDQTFGPDHGTSAFPDRPEFESPGAAGTSPAAPADADAGEGESLEGSTDIHVRYARLQQEVARLCEQQELQGLFFPEALPRYEDV